MRILCVGDFIEDFYIFGTATRLCPESPVPVVIPQATRTSAGGVGLVASQLRELGADVTEWRGSLSKKERIFCGNHLITRIDRDSFAFAAEPFPDLKEFDVIVVSDYSKGAMTGKLAAQIVETEKLVFVDAKHHWEYFDGLENVWLFPNEHEHVSMHYPHVVRKLGAEGCRLGDLHLKATVTEVVDVCGAGDIFMAGFVYAWTLQYPAEDCLRFANKIAGESCRHRGTYVVSSEFAQSVLDRLLASRESAQRVHDHALDSNLSSTPPPHVQALVERIAAEILAYNPDVDYVAVLGGPAAGPCNFPVAQIRRKSPSGPTLRNDVVIPPQSDTEPSNTSQSEESDQSPSAT